METQKPTNIDKRDESIKFSPLIPALGAKVSGVDFANEVSDSVKATLRQALLDYQVLIFRRQFLNEEQHIQFAQIFGKLRDMWQPQHYRSNSKLIHYLSNVDRDGVPVGFHPDRHSTYWHSDYTHAPVPARATVMNAVQIPANAGKTHFINMYQQYEYLDQATKDRLGNYEAEHHMGFRRAGRSKRLPWQWWSARRDGESIRSQLKWWKTTLQRRWQEGPVYHRVVRPHPDTGRLALFIGDHAWRVKGKFWPIGIKVMNEINAMAFDPSAIYTHTWEPGDLLIWDNGSLLHRLGRYDLNNHVRIMRRCVVLGDE